MNLRGSLSDFSRRVAPGRSVGIRQLPLADTALALGFRAAHLGQLLGLLSGAASSFGVVGQKAHARARCCCPSRQLRLCGPCRSVCGLCSASVARVVGWETRYVAPLLRRH